jgi:hypothetical protein
MLELIFPPVSFSFFSIVARLVVYEARGAPPTEVAFILALLGVAFSFFPLAAPNM